MLCQFTLVGRKEGRDDSLVGIDRALQIALPFEQDNYLLKLAIFVDVLPPEIL